MKKYAIIAAGLFGLVAAPQRVQAAASGLNNIPTADTAPHLTLVIQEYSTFGAHRKPDHTAGFKFGNRNPTGPHLGWACESSALAKR